MHITKEDPGLIIEDDRFTLRIVQWDGLTKKLAREACTWLETVLQDRSTLPTTLSAPMSPPSMPTPLITPQPPVEPLRQPEVVTELPVPELSPEPQVKEDTTQVIRNPKGQFSGLFTDDQQYRRDSRIPLYKPIADYLYENTGAVFTHRQVAALIASYWDTVLHRAISNNSKKTYSSSYIHLMKEIGWVRSYNGKRGVCKKIGKNNDPATIAKDIWTTAVEKNWTNNHRPVPLEMLAMTLPRYTPEEIKFGLARLVESNGVTQLASDKVMFNAV